MLGGELVSLPPLHRYYPPAARFPRLAARAVAPLRHSGSWRVLSLRKPRRRVAFFCAVGPSAPRALVARKLARGEFGAGGAPKGPNVRNLFQGLDTLQQILCTHI